VEKVDAKVDALIDVMGRAFPEFKKAAKERAEENRDSKEVRESLTGDAP
jgi:Sec-independent protein translocase protein TatA